MFNYLSHNSIQIVKNVIGKPCDNSVWLAKTKGFTSLGDNYSENLVLDPEIFEVNFIKSLDKMTQVDLKSLL